MKIETDNFSPKLGDKEEIPKSGTFNPPLGTWNLDGTWWPNSNLDMSASEQREHNIRNGYKMRGPYGDC